MSSSRNRARGKPDRSRPRRRRAAGFFFGLRLLALRTDRTVPDYGVHPDTQQEVDLQFWIAEHWPDRLH